MEDMEINGNNMGLPLRRYIFSVASVVVSYLFRVVAQMICSFRASQVIFVDAFCLFIYKVYTSNVYVD